MKKFTLQFKKEFIRKKLFEEYRRNYSYKWAKIKAKEEIELLSWKGIQDLFTRYKLIEDKFL